LDPLQDCRIVADFRKKVGFCFYGYLGPPPRLPYCDLKKKVGFCFYGWLGPPPRLPYSGFGEKKKGKVSTAVRYLRAAPYVFLKKGFYGGTLRTSYAVRVFRERKSSYGGTLKLRHTCFRTKEVLTAARDYAVFPYISEGSRKNTAILDPLQKRRKSE